MTACAIKQIIQFNEAQSYTDDIHVQSKFNGEITLLCEWSWSVDGVCWTSWVDYATYKRICSTLESDYFLRIRTSYVLEYIVIRGLVEECYTTCIDNSNFFLQDLCSNAVFNPYANLDCALLMQQQLADSVICMLGIPIYYIRVVPQDDSADYTFKEWVLHNVQDVKQLKLMIQDGQMPSSNPKLTEFDFEWETDWETEISKTHFATAFGDTAFPKQRDLIYIPLMKRLWEVNSAYDEKNEGLMWRPTTWKLALVKYNEKTNVNQGNFEDLIDTWTVNDYKDVFGDLEQEEQQRESGTLLTAEPQYAATNLYNIEMEDAIRKSYTYGQLSVIDKIYCHHNTIVARNYYRFKTEDAALVYQKGVCGDQGTIQLMLETQGEYDTDRTVLKAGNLELKLRCDGKHYTLTCEGSEAELAAWTNYLVSINWNKQLDVMEFHVYQCKHPENIPSYRLRPESYYYDFENGMVSVSKLNPDIIADKPQQLIITGWPCFMSNIKYYNRYLDSEQTIRELVKYASTEPECVICDCSRPFIGAHGYAVK